jgi:hypothetical protein
MVTADFASTKVDLADLGGFIGTTEASRNLLPDTPISLPKLRAADVKLRGEHIVGRSVPLDNLVVNLSVINGKIALEPISFGVGTGRIAGTVALDGTAMSFAPRLRREALPQVGSRYSSRRTRAGTFSPFRCFRSAKPREEIVNGLIYLIGLIVVILFILSFLGLR